MLRFDVLIMVGRCDPMSMRHWRTHFIFLSFRLSLLSSLYIILSLAFCSFARISPQLDSHTGWHAEKRFSHLPPAYLQQLTARIYLNSCSEWWSTLFQSDRISSWFCGTFTARRHRSHSRDRRENKDESPRPKNRKEIKDDSSRSKDRRENRGESSRSNRDRHHDRHHSPRSKSRSPSRSETSSHRDRQSTSRRDTSKDRHHRSSHSHSHRDRKSSSSSSSRRRGSRSRSRSRSRSSDSDSDLESKLWNRDWPSIARRYIIIETNSKHHNIILN